MGDSIREPAWLAARSERLRPDDLLRVLEIEAPAVPVESITRRLGVHLHKVPQLGYDGALTSTTSEAHIWVDSSRPGVRQRFTIAHELGHLMLHPLGTTFRDINSTNSFNKQESQANRFAADLLMPEWMVRAYLSSTESPEALASVFDVSAQAMTIRLNAMRMGSTRRYG